MAGQTISRPVLSQLSKGQGRNFEIGEGSNSIYRGTVGDLGHFCPEILVEGSFRNDEGFIINMPEGGHSAECESSLEMRDLAARGEESLGTSLPGNSEEEDLASEDTRINRVDFTALRW